MFCPNCGTGNSKGQKFCTRCGTNMLAIDRAREIIGEIATGTASSSVSSNMLLTILAIVSVIGFIAITIGTVELYRLDNGHSPMPIIFGMGGFISLVTICRYLIGLLKPGAKVEMKQVNEAGIYHQAQPSSGVSTNRALNESSTAYSSVIEDSTRQFERERNSN